MEKILVLANHVLGIYSFRRELIQSLIDEGHEVYISAPKDDKMEYFTKMGCKCIETPINRRGTNPLTDIKLLLNYLKIIMKVKPSIILTYTIKPNIYGGLAARILNKMYIANITGLGTVVENKGMLQKVSLNLYRLALKQAQCVFFQNEENKNFFESKKIAVGKHKLLPGSGVNLDYFKLMDYPRENKIEFIFIARIMKEKGIEQYLETAQYITEKYPNTHFNILGNCEEEYIEQLKLLQSKGIITYHGRQADVRKFIKTSHCTIHPTYYPEGMSNVLLESAACGRPVITTDRSGCREIVEIGKTGYIIKQKSSRDLIEKVESFLQLDFSSKKHMGILGRKKVEQEFDRKIVVDAYLTEIEKKIRES